MKIAQYQGVSFTSKAIRFITRSKWSHSAFLFDEQSHAACVRLLRSGKLGRKDLDYINDGAVIEAWLPDVRNLRSISARHTPGTVVDVFEPRQLLSPSEEERLILSLVPELGTPYNVRDVLRFITRRPGRLDRTWFCSELVFQKLSDVKRTLFQQTQAWEVPPGWVPRSNALRYAYSTTTV